MNGLGRIELEEAMLKWFRNAKPETQERVFGNLIFKSSFDDLKSMYEAEVNSGEYENLLF